METKLEIEVTPKLSGYLRALAESEHGYGSTPEQVALFLVWQSINRLRTRGRILDAWRETDR